MREGRAGTGVAHRCWYCWRCLQSLHEGRKPLMALQIQRVWRGHVARERVKR